MSAAEILSQLPSLAPEEIDAVYFQSAALRHHSIPASENLLAAIVEADASVEKEGGRSLDEIETAVKTWPTK